MARRRRAAGFSAREREGWIVVGIAGRIFLAAQALKWALRWLVARSFVRGVLTEQAVRADRLFCWCVLAVLWLYLLWRYVVPWERLARQWKKSFCFLLGRPRFKPRASPGVFSTRQKKI